MSEAKPRLPSLTSTDSRPWGTWIGSTLLGLILLLAVLPPPQNPARIDDPVGTRLLPPATILVGVPFADGAFRFGAQATRIGDHWRLVSPDGTVREIPIVDAPDEATAQSPHTTGLVRRHHWLGTDKFGRDLLSRLMQGARISLSVSAFSVLLAGLLGITLGALAALGGGWIDTLVMRTVDTMMSLPALFLVIALAAIFRPSTTLLVALLGGASWMPLCRIARGEILSLKERDFIAASRGIGASPLRVAWRHLLPNALTPLVVEATLLFGNLMLTEAALSYIGFGVQPPTASWGNMLREGQETIALAWWPTVIPGIVITLAVLAVNLLGDQLRDRLDPRQGTPRSHTP